ncbi:MAG: SUMF1/EgtB/PvdO family nonheme iron enzyme [Gammaproteobacteria bacterium]|nr:SUMF1/EgtB/PvdO family nonheme iron enzyme [Gammaproteobacteria bacterium]MBU1655042.1 SUMF1/EgtB/PvdO family nonheme iron enzyme [Gammaproteobacteria bacterium]MBU1961539.1 SUMF1/EgtB/PvdO family nonheme iron enzyme [Gammaproteobacteria bacterium]
MKTYRHALPTNGLITDRYRILEILGEGGFGITYKAWDERLRRQVVIKEYLPAEMGIRDRDAQTILPRTEREGDLRYGLEKFLEEAVALAQFSHPNIVKVLDWFEANGTAYLVMEHEEGETLFDHLRGRGAPMGEGEIRDLLIPLLQGLMSVHRIGLLHRDIKPDNIFLRKGGGPLLIDFGAARHALGVHSKSLSVILSKGYAPPEQYSSRGKQGPATDLYALGAVLYELVTGKIPLESVVRSHALSEGEPDPITPARKAGQGRASAWLLDLIDRLLCLSFKDRPQDCAEVLKCVGSELQGGGMPHPSLIPPGHEDLLARQGTYQLPEAERFGQSKPAAAKGKSTEWGILVAGVLVVIVVLGIGASLFGGGNGGKVEILQPEQVQGLMGESEAAQGDLSQGFESGEAFESGEESEAAAPRLEETTGVPFESPAPPRLDSPEEVQDDLTGMAFVPIKGGCFPMGSPESEQGRDDDEQRHPVCVEDFAMGKYEVRVGEFRKFVEAAQYKTDAERSAGGAKGCAGITRRGKLGFVKGLSWRNPGYEQSNEYPVTCVSWNDAMAFAEWLSRETGENYRLPSEAEWEYALRGGSETARWWGDAPEHACLYGNVADQTAKARWGGWKYIHDCNDRYALPAPVGQYRPNPFGLYDMSGNLGEWTCSGYAKEYENRETRCTGGSDEAPRVIRDGAWMSGPSEVRSADRRQAIAALRFFGLGFRLLRVAR